MILGHDRAVERFTSAMRSGTLHHAWLLAGPRGVGKAKFARTAATRLLGDAAGPRTDLPALDMAPDHPIARLMAAGSHPDFRLLEREWNEKSDTLRRNISVSQIRMLGEFFANTTSLSPWRAVIIDSVDDLETESANALLKMLEEPPANTVFLLVAHAPGRLLPTIRSRCRRLDFARLSDNAMASVLRRELPEAPEAELSRAITLGNGSVGRALEFAGLDLGAVEANATEIMRHGDPTNSRRSKLAQSVAGKAAAERYSAFLQLVPGLIAREARQLEGQQRERALDAYDRARETAAIAARLSLDPAATAFQLGSILASVP